MPCSPNLLLLLAAAVVTLPAGSVRAQTVPTGFVVDNLLITGLGASNDCCFLPDGRVLIADSDGLVTVYANGPAAVIGTVPNVESGGERGLLSIAADPAFSINGYVYVYYSSTLDPFMHLDRFACTGDLANPASTNLLLSTASRRVLLNTLPDNAGNHNGGSARFGPDGMLYLTVGDDASMCSAQSLTSQAGCLLRLATNALPPGGSSSAPSFALLDPGNNPLSANSDFSQLVIAHGLRNPFRMEIDPGTGSLYIGDVGAGAEEEYSEYVYPQTGALPLVNFGWPWREGAIAGFSCSGSVPPGLVSPLASVTHAAGWAAVMGGARYRNQGAAYDFGPAYEGNAFYLDFYAGELRRLVDTGTWGAAPAVPGQPTAADWGTGFQAVSSLRLGPDGALWFTERGGSGSLRRIRPTSPNNSIAVHAGNGQIGAFGDPLWSPLVVRVQDAQGNVLPGAAVNFATTGSVVLSTTNPVLTDSNGLAQTNVLSSNGGAYTVTATTPSATSVATFNLFARHLQALSTIGLLVLSVSNTTTAVPAQVPCILFMSFPGSPVLPTFLGPLCTDPFYPGTFAIEDSIGLFGGVSLSGTGAMGGPGFVKVYSVPFAVLGGQLMSFQVVGLDPVEGFFRTNCATKQF